MAEIEIRLDVDDVDPRLVDPLDVATYLLGLHDVEVRSGNAPFILAEGHLEAEWT